MPMPHRTFAQVAKRRLIGKEGRERIRAVRELLEELPDYRNGPYADLRKWLTSEIEETRIRSSAVHRDSMACLSVLAWRPMSFFRSGDAPPIICIHDATMLFLRPR